MPRKTDKPLIRVAVRLFKEDYEALNRMTNSDVKKNELIRRVIHTFIVHNEDRVRAKIDNLTMPHIDLDLDLKDIKE